MEQTGSSLSAGNRKDAVVTNWAVADGYMEKGGQPLKIWFQVHLMFGKSLVQFQFECFTQGSIRVVCSEHSPVN